MRWPEVLQLLCECLEDGAGGAGGQDPRGYAARFSLGSVTLLSGPATAILQRPESKTGKSVRFPFRARW